MKIFKRYLFGNSVVSTNQSETGQTAWKLVMGRLLPILMLVVIAQGTSVADPITGSTTIHVNVGVSGTGSSHGNDYKGPDTVTATYSIATKTDSSGKVTWDLANSTITFKDTKYDWSTLAIPVKGITGDPDKGTVTKLDFEGPWYPNADSDDIVDKGAKGSIDLSSNELKLDASYHGNQSGWDYTYSVTPEPSTLVLFGSSILGLSGLLRKRWQARA